MAHFNSKVIKWHGYAVLSALLFGISVPAEKYYLPRINPFLLAGLLYLSSAIALTVMMLLRRNILTKDISFSFNYKTYKYLTISVILGGIAGPALLLLGLSRNSAVLSSLLLNFESVFTVLFAWLFFKERTDFHKFFAISLIIAGSLILTWKEQSEFNSILGVCLVLAADLCWSLENNVIKKISYSDPILLSLVKCGVAGITNTAIGLFIDGSIAISFNLLIMISLVGIVCYAISMILFILALRNIGVAQTGACYLLSPFIGAIFSVIFLGEKASYQIIIGSLIIVLGAILHLWKIIINDI